MQFLTSKAYFLHFERNLHDGFDIDSLILFRARMEAPAVQRCDRALIESFIDGSQYFHVGDRTIGADDGIEDHRPFDLRGDRRGDPVRRRDPQAGERTLERRVASGPGDRQQGRLRQAGIQFPQLDHA